MSRRKTEVSWVITPVAAANTIGKSLAAISAYEWNSIHHDEMMKIVDQKMLKLVKEYPILLAIMKNINQVTSLVALLPQRCPG